MVGQWVDWVRERASNPAVESLSLKAVLNHIPPVVESLGHYVINPTYAVREEMLGHLKMHGQIRRDQGYDIRDVMAELDGLSHLIMHRMQAEVLASDEAAGQRFGLKAALTVFGRLSGGLRALAFVTLGVYRDSEEDRRQELARRLAEFGRTIGHELRSPLNSISLSASVLEHAELWSDEARRGHQLGVIRTAVQHAEGLLYDIDLLAMVQSAQSAPRMNPLPVVLEAVREEMLARAKARDVELDLAPSPPRLSVETVVAQLTLTNVISNAIKYCDPDKDSRWVKVLATTDESADATYVVLEVEDNGLGIPGELQSRVFQRHFRGHPDVAEGTGLGLAITHELLVERGGRIDVESEEGRGTCVRVRLPAIDADSVAAYTRSERPEGLMHLAVRELVEQDAARAADEPNA